MPELKRLSQLVRTGVGIAPLERRTCGCPQPFEPPQVDLVGLDLEHVSRSARRDDPWAQRLAQSRDVPLQRRRGRRRWLPVPELVDQPVARDDAVRVKHQKRENRALLPTPKRDGAPVFPYFDRPKDAELHRALAFTLTACDRARESSLAPR